MDQNQTYKVQVQWGRKLLKDVEFTMEDTFETFFNVLYSLTSVDMKKSYLLRGGQMLKVFYKLNGTISDLIS